MKVTFILGIFYVVGTHCLIEELPVKDGDEVKIIPAVLQNFTTVDVEKDLAKSASTNKKAKRQSGRSSSKQGSKPKTKSYSGPNGYVTVTESKPQRYETSYHYSSDQPDQGYSNTKRHKYGKDEEKDIDDNVQDFDYDSNTKADRKEKSVEAAPARRSPSRNRYEDENNNNDDDYNDNGYNSGSSGSSRSSSRPSSSSRRNNRRKDDENDNVDFDYDDRYNDDNDDENSGSGSRRGGSGSRSSGNGRRGSSRNRDRSTDDFDDAGGDDSRSGRDDDSDSRSSRGRASRGEEENYGPTGFNEADLYGEVGEPSGNTGRRGSSRGRDSSTASARNTFSYDPKEFETGIYASTGNEDGDEDLEGEISSSNGRSNNRGNNENVFDFEFDYSNPFGEDKALRERIRARDTKERREREKSYSNFITPSV